MATPRSTGASAFTAASTRQRSARPKAAPPAPGTTERRKYTLRLDEPAADAFDRAVLALMPEVGRRVDKNEALAVLTELLATDQDVAAKVTRRLRHSAR